MAGGRTALGASLAGAAALARDAPARARGGAALGVAHARGIVHRDVKPENLFLVEGDVARVKVLDFGLAWLANAQSRFTAHGAIVGTPGYMAPEQALAERALDARADVFSLGAVLYQCLAGRPPFVADHPIALLAKIVLEDPPRVGASRRDLPPALEVLVTSMLAKDRARRPIDASAVEAALEPITSDFVEATTTRFAVTSPSEKEVVCIALVAPDAPSETLSDVEALRGELASYGASVEQLTDGTLVALIAGRGAATDRATAAARCALTLRERLPRRAIALTTGLAVVGAGMPWGDAIDRAAARLLGHDDAGVWLDDVTASLVGARFEVELREGQPLLLGAREELDDTRLFLGRATPFVGRERDLSFVLGLFEETISERVGSAVVVTAPAGTGKSRLRHEMLRRVSSGFPETEVWFGRGDPVSVGSPFALLGPALRRVAEIVDGEPIDVRRRKLASRVGRHVAPLDRGRVTDFLGELVGAPTPDHEASLPLRSARQNPMLMAGEVLRAFEDLVAAECAVHPLLLVFEDLHWGDLPSVRFVDAVLRSQSDAPLFVLALARPEVHELFPNLWRGRRVQELVLPELTRRASTTLARHALGPSASEGVIARLVDRAAGNPFFLEELVRALAEGHGETSDTVLVMIQSRTEALPARERRVLRAASVFGEVFWSGGIAAVTGSSPDSIEPLIESLIGRELLVRRATATFPSEIELAFRHGLVREGAYATLTDDDRRAAHLAAGTWLEGAGETNALVLAEHFERGERPERAATHYARASQQAFEGGDVHHAIACAERGFGANVQGALRVELFAAACTAHSWSGGWREAARYGDALMALVPRGSQYWSMAASTVAFAAITLGEHSTSAPVLEALLEVEPEPGGRGALAWALSSGSTVLYFAGGSRSTARRMLERLEVITAPVAVIEPGARANLERARAYAARYLDGDLVAALSFTRRAMASFDEAGDRATMSLVALDLCTTLFRLGQLREVEASVARLIERTDAVGLDTPGGFARIELARVACELGDGETVRACAAWVFERLPPAGGQPAQARLIVAETARREGDLEAAEAEARRALELLSPTSSDALAARCTLARTLLAKGAPAEALSLAEENIRRLEDTSHITTDESRVFTTLAEARLAAGLDARSAFERARDDLRRRASNLEPALREGYLTGLEVNRRTVELVRAHLGEAIG
ncbi:MAG: AAA family ATPase [Sandaracinaceae bacterium]|nr:AAA family ATPase [Sandaracinaceae bacterium]